MIAKNSAILSEEPAEWVYSSKVLDVSQISLKKKDFPLWVQKLQSH